MRNINPLHLALEHYRLEHKKIERENIFLDESLNVLTNQPSCLVKDDENVLMFQPGQQVEIFREVEQQEHSTNWMGELPSYIQPNQNASQITTTTISEQ